MIRDRLGKVEHDLVELLVVAVSAVLSEIDTFVDIQEWATEELDWLHEHLKLPYGIDDSSRPMSATYLVQAGRSHWPVENRLHWYMDVTISDD
jgi:hypothetical protein